MFEWAERVVGRAGHPQAGVQGGGLKLLDLASKSKVLLLATLTRICKDRGQALKGLQLFRSALQKNPGYQKVERFCIASIGMHF